MESITVGSRPIGTRIAMNTEGRDTTTETTPSSGIPCGACGEWADEPAGRIPFYLKTGSIDTVIWKCKQCGTYVRETDYENPTIRAHFDITSYTDPATELYWRDIRTGLFKYVIELSSVHLGRNLHGIRSLDLGTAFGILLELLAESGAEPEGVEIVETLRARAHARGLLVHRDLNSLPAQSYDLVTAIDSFYYMNDPCATLMRLKELLKADGLLVMRLTNRTWFFDVSRMLGIGITAARFDDIKFNYSIHGAIALLERSGFWVEQIYWADQGRGDVRPLAKAYYRFSPILAEYLTLRISPGMILVARPADSKP
jgi:SAM-dependent methyltransferase